MDLEKISAIIIDDEPDAINLLSLYLRHYPSINVIGSETDAKKGLTLVGETLPELVFLDIDMPDMNGLQVAASIQSENFHSEIVFTTAYQHYAYDAIGVEPLDFITKPYSIEDLDLVIIKYKEKLEKKKLEHKLDKFIHSQSNSPKLKLPANHGVVIVDIKDIVIIRSRANKCELQLQDGTKEIINKNLNVLIDILNSSVFFKLSRSNYINLNFLTRVDKKNNTCFLSFNQTIHEETITREQIIYFEKLELFAVIKTH
jgi:two-component system LytT family response regulator